MSYRLVATHLTCSTNSYAGAARFARTRVCSQFFPSRQWRPFLHAPGVFQNPRSSASFAPAPPVGQDGALEEDAEPESLGPYDLTNPNALDTHYNTLLNRSPGFLDDDSFARWRQFRQVNGSIDENIIAVVDKYESLMSFEGDEDDAHFPIKEYWDSLCSMLGFAYQSGNSRAQHALETYRYRAREFVGVLSETTVDPTDRTVILSTLIGCIANSPHDTLRVLSSHLTVPFYARADCCFRLRHIPDRWAEIRNNPELHQLYRQSLEVLGDRARWKTIPALPPGQLTLLLETLPREEALRLVTDWQTIFPHMRDSEAVWLVETYTNLGDIDNAVQALTKVSSKLLRNPNHALMKACVNLLKFDVVDNHTTSHSFRILPALLELGLPPQDIIQNMVVQNTAKSGLVGVAFDLYESLETQNIPIHGHTMTTLLKQSLRNQDVQVMDKLMTMIQTHENLSRNPYVMAVMMTIVRHIAHWKRKLGPEQCLSYLLAIYDRAYNREALGRVGILEPQQVQSGDSTLPDPHPIALQNFIFAFVLMQKQEVRVRQVWECIVSILNGKDQSMIKSLQRSRVSPVFHAFLLFYQRSPFTLDAMLEVLQYMVKNHPELVEVPAWAIVVGGFLRHGQDDMVKFVQELMRLSARQAPTLGHAERLEAWLERRPQKAELVAYVKDLEAGAMLGTEAQTSEERMHMG